MVRSMRYVVDTNIKLVDGKDIWRQVLLALCCDLWEGRERMSKARTTEERLY